MRQNVDVNDLFESENFTDHFFEQSGDFSRFFVLIRFRVFDCIEKTVAFAIVVHVIRFFDAKGTFIFVFIGKWDDAGANFCAQGDEFVMKLAFDDDMFFVTDVAFFFQLIERASSFVRPFDFVVWRREMTGFMMLFYDALVTSFD